jgi:replication initiation and membrane attachment protein DnaB
MIENSIVNSWKDVYELKEQKATGYNKKPIREEIVPEWFNKEQKKEKMSAEDQAEVDELFKRFDEEGRPRSTFEERKKALEEKLKSKYGKKKKV